MSSPAVGRYRWHTMPFSDWKELPRRRQSLCWPQVSARRDCLWATGSYIQASILRLPCRTKVWDRMRGLRALRQATSLFCQEWHCGMPLSHRNCLRVRAKIQLSSPVCRGWIHRQCRVVKRPRLRWLGFQPGNAICCRVRQPNRLSRQSILSWIRILLFVTCIKIHYIMYVSWKRDATVRPKCEQTWNSLCSGDARIDDK